MEMPAISE